MNILSYGIGAFLVLPLWAGVFMSGGPAGPTLLITLPPAAMTITLPAKAPVDASAVPPAQPTVPRP